jgi:hypothetical protein
MISTTYLDSLIKHIKNSVPFVFYFIYNRHFLPCRRADLTTSEDLRRNAVEYHSLFATTPQLQQPRLVNNPGRSCALRIDSFRINRPRREEG